MEHASFPDRQLMTATLLRFVFFLGGMVNERQWHFEQEMEGCHPEDVRVLFLWMEPHVFQHQHISIAKCFAATLNLSSDALIHEANIYSKQLTQPTCNDL